MLYSYITKNLIGLQDIILENVKQEKEVNEVIDIVTEKVRKEA